MLAYFNGLTEVSVGYPGLAGVSVGYPGLAEL